MQHHHHANATTEDSDLEATFGKDTKTLLLLMSLRLLDPQTNNNNKIAKGKDTNKESTHRAVLHVQTTAQFAQSFCVFEIALSSSSYNAH